MLPRATATAHFILCDALQWKGSSRKSSKPKHCYKVRCGILRSSDIVYGLRVHKLKSREKYVRRERVKLRPFVKLTEEQAHIAATALRTTSVKKAPARYSRKKNQNKLVPQSGLYQTMFENFVNSRQDKKPNCQHLLTIVLFAMLISDSAYVFFLDVVFVIHVQVLRCLGFSQTNCTFKKYVIFKMS